MLPRPFQHFMTTAPAHFGGAFRGETPEVVSGTVGVARKCGNPRRTEGDPSLTRTEAQWRPEVPSNSSIEGRPSTDGHGLES